MDLVLVHPEIPHNTGCVARTAAATGIALHLVEPLGYKLDDRYLKRAGLDYWPLVDLHVHADWGALERALAGPRPLGERLRLFSARGGTSLFDVPFASDDVLVFGRESDGLPPALVDAYPKARVLIPILPAVRSLNLAAAACLSAYTALARSGHRFPNPEAIHQRDPRMDLDLFAADVARRSSSEP